MRLDPESVGCLPRTFSGECRVQRGASSVLAPMPFRADGTHPWRRVVSRAMTGDAPRYPPELAWGLAALAVRAALAARAPIIEVDGAYWAGLAAALERGDLRHGLSSAWPPLYPA